MDKKIVCWLCLQIAITDGAKNGNGADISRLQGYRSIWDS